MTSLRSIVYLLCALPLGLAFAQTGPAGHWEGDGDSELRIALDLVRNDKGAWVGAFAQTSQGIRNVPLTGFKFDGNSVKFGIGIPGPTAPSFDCALRGAASLDCTVAAWDNLTVSFKRTGEAKVELPKTGAKVSKELEGDWEGATHTPIGSHQMVVHFQNQPDYGVMASADSPDENVMGLPLTDVVQKGSTVEFQLRIAQGAYKGTLNKEGTLITGEWSQGGTTFPLQFKRPVAK